jgi:hypothetical protein
MQVSRYFIFITVCAITASVGRKSAADNVCKETVPSNRFVDGFPAYSQCAASTDSSIWSSNGINTNTTTPGTGWALTQLTGGYQSTEFVYRYLYFKWNVNYRANGVAKDWCDDTLPNTLKKTSTPVHGDVIVFAPGACDADWSIGHLAVVDTVDKAASAVTIVEQSPVGRRSCAIGTASCFLHVVANGGTSSNGGTTGGGGAAGVGGKTGASGKGSGTAGVVGFAGKSGSSATPSAAAGEADFGFGGTAVADVAAVDGTKNTDGGCSCDLTRGSGHRSDTLILLVGVLMLAARSRSRVIQSLPFTPQPSRRPNRP